MGDGYRLSAISLFSSMPNFPTSDLRLAVLPSRRLAVFDFELAFEAHGGPLWLRLRGSPPVKAFIAEAFNSRIS